MYQCMHSLFVCCARECECASVQYCIASEVDKQNTVIGAEVAIAILVSYDLVLHGCILAQEYGLVKKWAQNGDVLFLERSSHGCIIGTLLWFIILEAAAVVLVVVGAQTYIISCC